MVHRYNLQDIFIDSNLLLIIHNITNVYYIDIIFLLYKNNMWLNITIVKIFRKAVILLNKKIFQNYFFHILKKNIPPVLSGWYTIALLTASCITTYNIIFLPHVCCTHNTVCYVISHNIQSLIYILRTLSDRDTYYIIFCSVA